MWKRLLRYGIVGFLAGVALNNILAIILSYALHLGYLMPYPAMLPENVGGEMNAGLIVMLVCGWLGGGIGLAFGFIQSHDMKPIPRRVFAVLSLCVSVLPTLMLVFSIM